MSRFMRHRQISTPPGYAERGCVLVSYQLPMLRHCHVLCSEADEAIDDAQRVALMAFFLIEAQRLAQAAVGDPQAFMLIHSGQSARKRASWHLHVFVVRSRWQKAWVYTVLAAKNLTLSMLLALRRMWSTIRIPIRALSVSPSSMNPSPAASTRASDASCPDVPRIRAERDS